MPANPPEQHQRVFHLQHGITFSISHTARDVSVQAIEQFLAGALDYFQNHREEAANTLKGYEGHWYSQAKSGRKVHGTAQLVHSGDEQHNLLPRESWAKSLAIAHSAANTLTQIQEQLDAYKAHATPGDWITPVIEALGRRNGNMDAFDLMMQHLLKTQSA